MEEKMLAVFVWLPVRLGHNSNLPFKDKNTTQGNLAELVGSLVALFGVSSPPSLGSSVLCSLQSF